MPFRRGLPLLLIAAVLNVPAFLFVYGKHALHKRGHCEQQTSGPTRLMWCADKRAYTVIEGKWQDAGPLTALPLVPKD